VSSVLKVVLAVALFAVWVPVFLLFSWFIVGGLMFGKLGLPLDYEMPFMGLMLLPCLLSYTFLVNYALQKAAR